MRMLRTINDGRLRSAGSRRAHALAVDAVADEDHIARLGARGREIDSRKRMGGGAIGVLWRCGGVHDPLGGL